MQNYLKFDVTLLQPTPLNVVLPIFDRELKQLGFSLRRPKAYLRSIHDFIKWPDCDREFIKGEVIDFSYVGERQFRDKLEKEPFHLVFDIMTGNSINGGAISFGVETNISAYATDQPWWPEVLELTIKVASRLHEVFDCQCTTVYGNRFDANEISSLPPEVFFERKKERDGEP